MGQNKIGTIITKKPSILTFYLTTVWAEIETMRVVSNIKKCAAGRLPEQNVKNVHAVLQESFELV